MKQPTSFGGKLHSRKRLRFLGLVLALGILGMGPLQAGTPSQDFDAQAQADFQSIADYINSQFAKTMGFYSTLGWNTPPAVYDILGGPRLEVGVGAGADIVSLSNLSGLPLGALLVSSNVNLPAVFPIPFPIGTLRVGLLNGLDVGLRLSIIPNINLPDFGFAANSTGWGVDLRYKILDGIQLPTVIGAVSWDAMKGSFAISTGISQTSTYQDPTLGPVPAVVTGNSVFTEAWDVKSFGAKVMVGKDLGILYPFGSVGFQRSSGNVSAAITANGTQTVNGSSQAFNYAINSFALPVVFEPKFTVGFDIGEGFHWGVLGESNGTDVAASTSFRIQF